jgi:hypothetical protein
MPNDVGPIICLLILMNLLRREADTASDAREKVIFVTPVSAAGLHPQEQCIAKLQPGSIFMGSIWLRYVSRNFANFLRKATSRPDKPCIDPDERMNDIDLLGG